MSLDLALLPSSNATTYERALGVYSEEDPGIPDESGELVAYAKEVYDAYGDGDWPFAGDPIVEPGFVLLTVNPESWESEVPKLVERAHTRGLVALDPQWEKLFPPGQPYVIDK
jgi:hypothetical protein